MKLSSAPLILKHGGGEGGGGVKMDILKVKIKSRQILFSINIISSNEKNLFQCRQMA